MNSSAVLESSYLGVRPLATLWGLAVAGLSWSIVTLGRADSQQFKALPFLVIIAVVCIVFLYERWSRGIGLISGLGITLVAYLVMFAAVPIADVINDHRLTYHRAWWTAGWLSLVGVLSLYLGYRLILALGNRRASQFVREWSSSRAMFAGTAMMLVAMTAFGSLMIFLGGPGAYFSAFRQRTLLLQNAVPMILGVGLAIPACLIMAGRWLNRPTRVRALQLLLIWAPITIVAIGTLGARFRVAIMLLALLAIVHFGYRRINPLVLMVAIVATLAGFVIYAVQRNYVGSQQVAPLVNVENVYERYLVTHDSVGEFREFLTVVESVPNKLEYQEGRTLFSLIPGTDFPTGGQLYSSHFFGDLYASGTSISPSLPGELYMNFGVPGMMLGMLVFGCLVGIIESHFRRNRRRIGALLIYAFSLFSLAMILRGDVTSMTTYYLAGVLPLIVALRFCEPLSSTR